MIEFNNFAYIHTSRTGGTFTRCVLQDLFPKSYEVEYHLPINRYKGKCNKFISTIRNPFDWYVSVFHFYQQINHPITRDVYGFDNVIKLLLDIKGSKKYEMLVNYDWEKTSLPNLNKKDFEEYPNNVGFCSWLFERMTNLDTEKVRFIRFENLTTDLINILKEQYHLTKEQENNILSLPRKNTTERKHYREYYSDELKNLVYKRDKVIFDKFGYEF